MLFKTGYVAMVILVVPCTMVIAALTASPCFGHELQPPPEPKEYKEAVLGHSLTLQCVVETPSNATGRWYRIDGQKKTQIVDHSGSVSSGYEPTGDKTRGEHNLLIVKVARRDQTVFGCSHIHRTPQWYYINVTVVDAADSSAGVPSSAIINTLLASLFTVGLKGLQPPQVPQEHKVVMLGQPATLECLVTPQTNAKGRWFLFDGQNKTQIIDGHGSVMDGYEPTGSKALGEHNLFITQVAWRDQAVFCCAHIQRTPQWHCINVTVVDTTNSSATAPNLSIMGMLLAMLCMVAVKACIA